MARSIIPMLMKTVSALRPCRECLFLYACIQPDMCSPGVHIPRLARTPHGSSLFGKLTEYGGCFFRVGYRRGAVGLLSSFASIGGRTGRFIPPRKGPRNMVHLDIFVSLF